MNDGCQIEDLEKDKEACDWDNVRIFNSLNHGKYYSETVLSTKEFGDKLKNLGFDVGYVYRPATLIFNNHDQIISMLAKSRIFENEEHTLNWFKENHQNETVFILQYIKGVLISEDEFGDKIRYFTCDLNKKVD